MPGYADHDLTKYAYRSVRMADSLARLVPIQQAYIENLRLVLSGEVPADTAWPERSPSDPPTGAGPGSLAP